MSPPPADGSLRAVVLRVVRNTALRRLEAAFAIFNAAEYGTWVAILVYSYGHGGATTAGVVAVAQLVPSAVVAPLAGGLGDRYSPARVLRLGYLGQAATLALVAAAMLGHAPALAVYAAAVFAAPWLTITRPTHSVLVPALVRSADELTAANAMSGWCASLGIVIGPILAGIAIGPLGPGGVFALLAAATLGAYLAVRPFAAPAADADEADDEAAAAGVLDALRHPGVATLLAVLGAQWIALGALDILTVVLAYSLLHAGSGGVAWLNASFGVGGVASVLVTIRLVGRPRLVPPMLLAAVLWGVAFAGLAVQSHLLVAFALLAVAGAMSSGMEVAGQTLLQRLAPADVLARVFGLLEGIGMAGLALGSLLVPAVVRLDGPRASVLAVGVALPLIVLAFLPWLRPVDAHATVPIVEINLLRGIPLFAALAAPELEAIARSLTPLERPAGTAIVREGEPGHEVYAVADGVLTVVRGGVEVDTLRRGEVFGELALLYDAPRNATVTAATQVYLYALAREPFLAALTRHPRARTLAEALADERTVRIAT